MSNQNNNEVESISNFAINLSETVGRFPISETQKLEIIKKCSEIVILFKKMSGKLVFPTIWFDEMQKTTICLLNSVPYMVQVEITDTNVVNFFGIDSVSEANENSGKNPGNRTSVEIGLPHYMNRPDVAMKDRKHWVN